MIMSLWKNTDISALKKEIMPCKQGLLTFLFIVEVNKIKMLTEHV